MAPIVVTALQGLLLVLLYLFVWRIARAVVRDLRTAGPVGPLVAAAPREVVPARAAPPAGAPQQRVVPRELVVHHAEGAPAVYALDGRDVSFGRAAPATVILDDPYVSDRHARVFAQGGEWLVADLGSTNGTFVNQARVTAPTPLAAGDQLGIGSTVVEARQ